VMRKPLSVEPRKSRAPAYLNPASCFRRRCPNGGQAAFRLGSKPEIFAASKSGPLSPNERTLSFAPQRHACPPRCRRDPQSEPRRRFRQQREQRKRFNFEISGNGVGSGKPTASKLNRASCRQSARAQVTEAPVIPSRRVSAMVGGVGEGFMELPGDAMATHRQLVGDTI
jgi:hypothetical protein